MRKTLFSVIALIGFLSINPISVHADVNTLTFTVDGYVGYIDLASDNSIVAEQFAEFVHVFLVDRGIEPIGDVVLSESLSAIFLEEKMALMTELVTALGYIQLLDYEDEGQLEEFVHEAVRVIDEFNLDVDLLDSEGNYIDIASFMTTNERFTSTTLARPVWLSYVFNRFIVLFTTW